MANPPSRRSSSASASAVLLFALLALATAPALAWACGYVEEDASGATSFDPHVIGGGPALTPQFYDPFQPWIGGCWGCDQDELLADWAGYLGTTFAADWKRVLYQAPLADLEGLIFFLAGKQPKPPPGWESTTLSTAPAAAREKLVPALYLVGFARRVEPFAEGIASDWDGPRARLEHEARVKAAGDPAALQTNGEKALARAKDPFLRQRYAFLLLRLRFHRQDWDGVVRFSDANAATLGGPSASLRWRSRYYVAGAHWRSGRWSGSRRTRSPGSRASPRSTPAPTSSSCSRCAR